MKQQSNCNQLDHTSLKTKPKRSKDETAPPLQQKASITVQIHAGATPLSAASPWPNTLRAIAQDTPYLSPCTPTSSGQCVDISRDMHEPLLGAPYCIPRRAADPPGTILLHNMACSRPSPGAPYCTLGRTLLHALVCSRPSREHLAARHAGPSPVLGLSRGDPGLV